MRRIVKVDIGIIAICIIAITSLTGCFGYNIAVQPENNTEKEFKEPSKSISQSIESEVATNGSIKLGIQNICINNPENLNKANTYYDPSISLIVTQDEKTEALNINLKSPIDTKDKSQQEDILVYLQDISNIHYTNEGDDYVEIKDSPNKYYIENELKYHSYVADIYINKNNNSLNFGENTHKEGKNGRVQTSTQQIK